MLMSLFACLSAPASASLQRRGSPASVKQRFVAKANPYGAWPNPFTVKPNPYGAWPNPFTIKPNPYGAWPNPFTIKPNPYAP
jgi:hypothetical protein